MEHEDAGDEEERHDEDRDRSNLTEKREVKSGWAAAVKLLTLIPGESSV